VYLSYEFFSSVQKLGRPYCSSGFGFEDWESSSRICSLTSIFCFIAINPA
jgi:hypothetical protein